MGVFHDQTKIFNRAPWPLNVRFDGQEISIPTGESFLPTICLLHAMNQNPMMGTQDVDNPNVGGCEYLIGLPEKARKYPCDPLTDEEIQSQRNNPSRWDYLPLMEGKLGKHDHVETRGRKMPSAYEAGIKTPLPTDRND